MHGAGAISVASCICRMLSSMSPNRPVHEGSNGLLMQEPKLNPDNHVWRHMWANAGLFLVRRAALQRGAPAVYTKTARERSDKRRPPTIMAFTGTHTTPVSLKESPGLRPHCGKGSVDEAKAVSLTPVKPKSFLPAVIGKSCLTAGGVPKIGSQRPGR